jgi:hypothetical protein
MILEIIGYEKVMWQYHHTESYTEDGQQKTKTEIREHKDEKNFFKDHFKLIEYPGGFPVGRFSYPFQYRLPDSLPGCIHKSRKGALKMKAKIQYKMKCIVEIPGFFTHDLKVKQHLVIHEKLDKLIEPKHHHKEATVRTLCCIPRGPLRCSVWMNKNAYMAGETASVHVSVDNSSQVDVTHFTSKLIREITLEAHGHRQTFRDIICQQKYPGTQKLTKKDSDIPLPLFGKKGHVIHSSTSSRLVKCQYKMMIEMEIPWAPDLEIFSPVTIYAPQSQAWATWQPPVWISEAQIQAVNSKISVPNEIAITMNTNAMHKPEILVPTTYNPSKIPNIKVEISNHNNSETAPLLKSN